MACKGCEASVPQVQGYPMETGADGGHVWFTTYPYPPGFDTDDIDTDADPFPSEPPKWAFKQDPEPVVEDDSFTAEVELDGVTITGSDGTCTDSGGTCVEATPCEFTVVVSFTASYFAITDGTAPTSQEGLEAILPVLTFGFTPEPGAVQTSTELRLTGYNPPNLGDEFPLASYSWEREFELQWTVTGECGQTAPENVTLSPATNMTITSPTAIDDPEIGYGDSRNVEIEFAMRCYACGGTSAGDVKQDTKKNTNSASITATVNAQQQ